MKSKTSKSLMLALMLCIITMSGCKKENGMIGNSDVSKSSENLTEQRIQNFITLMNSGSTLKTSSEYHKDSAIWYVESTLNYTYADAKVLFEEFIVDSCFVECCISNDSISSANVTAVYNKMKDSLSTQYDDINHQNKHLVVADIFIKSVNNNIASIGMISGFNYGISASSGVFGDDDYWKYGEAWMNDGGYCDGQYSGTQLDESAATQIESIIRLRNAAPTGRYYYINILSLRVEADGSILFLNTGESDYVNLINPDDEYEQDNLYDYLMFHNYSAWSNFHDCLIPDEMNFYLENTEDVFKDILIDELSELTDKVFISCEMVGEAIFWPVETTYFHYSINEYGEIVFTNNQTSSL
ncbi:MAG: hypothetical protein U5Q03_07400 [Bacteroidota bacterium]|nr:hypothetical protein [Bacteroidota bacterium]